MGMYEIRNPEDFFRAFPNLDRSIDPSSRAIKIYNCIAYTMDDKNNWWWPLPDSKDTSWPTNCPKEETIKAFECAFATEGYQPCRNGELEEGYQKIALYADETGPTHAAKQTVDGRWKSKCGGNVDIEHELEELEGPCYGKVVMFFRRHRKTS